MVSDKASGKAKCPYCGERLDKKPKQAKKCPNCGNKIRVRQGKLYTEQGADKEDRRRVHKHRRQWVTERLLQYESYGKHYARIVGDEDGFRCDVCERWNGKEVRVEDALGAVGKEVPPFESCQSTYCRCTIVPGASRRNAKAEKEESGCLLMVFAVLLSFLFLTWL